MSTIYIWTQWLFDAALFDDIILAVKLFIKKFQNVLYT